MESGGIYVDIGGVGCEVVRGWMGGRNGISSVENK